MPERVHVVPVDDFVKHSDSEDCICGPELQRVEAEDGGDGWIVVHHSLDGREQEE